MSDLSDRKYVRWDAEGVEKIPPNEEEYMDAVIKQINTIQQMNFDRDRHAYGGTHCRTQGIVVGTFVVEDNLPQHLKQTELFQKGGKFPVACRYSTEPSDPGMDDRIPNPRGFAMKIFDVHGEMFDAGKDCPTQDIEFNSAPVIELADAKTTKEVFDIRLQHGGIHEEGTRKDLKQREDADLQLARYDVPVQHLESTRQYSQTAYRFGNYICKYCLVPNTQTQQDLAKAELKPDDGPDILHTWLSNFHTQHDAEYLFQVQLCENLEEQPVEYAGKEWDSGKYPWQTVAKLVIPKQESWDYERKSFWEDHMRVDPWHGLKSFQPLGSPNRLRRKLYPASSALRRKLNGRKEMHIKSINEIPNGPGGW